MEPVAVSGMDAWIEFIKILLMHLLESAVLTWVVCYVLTIIGGSCGVVWVAKRK